MSIYRKIGKEVRNDVYSISGPLETKEPEAEERVDPAREELERRKRSKGEPINVPLPRTSAWAATLPLDIQPRELLRSFGRIANLLAAHWDEPEATHAYFDQLLTGQRRNRQGFPAEILAELLALRRHYADLHPRTSYAWQEIRKR